MKIPLIRNSKTGLPDAMLTLAVLAGIVCIIRFLFDGVTLVIHGHTFSLGHVDSFSYSSILAPTLGAHSYTHVNTDAMVYPSGNIDDPDKGN